jgi:hypothetical protein
MADSKAITNQTGGRRYLYHDVLKSPLMIGGLTGIRAALMAYSPIETGYARLFMIRQPQFLTSYFTKNNDPAMSIFRHILQYGFTNISGIDAYTLNSSPYTGGHVAREIAMPTITSNSTANVNIDVYDFIGSPVREVLHMWITGISDPICGYTTYHGEVSVRDDDNKLPYNESNHTAEFIYVVTDKTGFRVEFACLLSHAWPTSEPVDQLTGYSAGQHELVKFSIPFSCIMEYSTVINTLAADLLNAYPVVSNSLNFNPRAGDAVYKSGTVNYDGLGKPLEGVKTIAPVGTSPVDGALYNPKTTPASRQYGPKVNPKNAGPTTDLMEFETFRG